MKKFGIFAVALAACAVCFTSCEDDGKKKPNLDTMPNGFYISEQGKELVAGNAMDQGINEVAQEARAGMYEKYLVLEAGKKYEFVNKKGEQKDIYGATLEYGEEMIVTDNAPVPGYKGSLAANTTIEVKETNLYHIVLDFNEDGSLTDVGGQQCIIVPANFGVRGAMNSWGFTEGVRDENYKFTWADVKVETAGAFKFAHSNAWKINLDIAELVKANTNLGMDCKPGGDDIALDRAIYTITLEYVGPAKTTQESFKATVEKSGDLEVLKPETFIYSFIGSINGNWDVDTDIPFASNDGNHYVFEAQNLDFQAGDFKVRFNHDWGKSFGFSKMTIEGAEVVAAASDDNSTLTAPFKGSVKFEFDWNGSAEENVKLTFIAE